LLLEEKCPDGLEPNAKRSVYSINKIFTVQNLVTPFTHQLSVLVGLRAIKHTDRRFIPAV
jgi:hypothetical protein